MEITDAKSSIWSASLEAQGDIVQGIDHINQCIIIVLQTRLGADPLRPGFGCGIFQKLDKPINQVRAALTNDVVSALNIWIPNITVVKITSVAEIGKLTVNVQWAFKNTVDTKQVNITYGIT